MLYHVPTCGYTQICVGSRDVTGVVRSVSRGWRVILREILRTNKSQSFREPRILYGRYRAVSCAIVWFGAKKGRIYARFFLPKKIKAGKKLKAGSIMEIHKRKKMKFKTAPQALNQRNTVSRTCANSPSFCILHGRIWGGGGGR